VPLRDLRHLGTTLIDIHGQSEQLSLLQPARQLDLLDDYSGLRNLRDRVAQLTRERRMLDREMEALRADEHNFAREVDLLKFQLDEIDGAALQPNEEQQLIAEHKRLANGRRLEELARSVEAALSPSDTGQSTEDGIHQALVDLREMAQLDHSFLSPMEQLEGLSELLDDIATSMRSYPDSINSDPQRLQELEARLAMLETLKRKYGNSVEDILQFGRSTLEQLNRIEHSSGKLAELTTLRSNVDCTLAATCADLSERRRAGATTLTNAMLHQLRDVGIKEVEFAIELSTSPDGEGIRLPSNNEPVRVDESGADSVTFLICPNPGMPLMPVAEIASGGETSRIMLALKATLGESDKTPTLIFDEVEQGIGARSARVVGEKLAMLARNHQVLVVTHLPQIAAFSDAHFYVEKTQHQNRTSIAVEKLQQKESLRELADMAGSGSGAEDSAGEMLRNAEEWRSQLRNG